MGEGTRTPDIQSHSLTATERNPLDANISGEPSARLAPVLAPGTPAPDLARVVSSWPTLPEPIRRAVLALLDAAAPGIAQNGP
ncbi:MAG TPA: hypothetical protein VH575_11050 [Gemmataceae bacterium]